MLITASHCFEELERTPGNSTSAEAVIKNLIRQGGTSAPGQGLAPKREAPLEFPGSPVAPPVIQPYGFRALGKPFFSVLPVAHSDGLLLLHDPKTLYR